MLGLEFSDLYPEQLPGHGNHRERRPFSASDALKCIARESIYVAIIAGDLARGEQLTESDCARLLVAAGRINTAIEVCGCQ